MENILLKLKKELKKVKLDVEVIHLLIGLPNKGEVPTTTERSEVYCET